MHQALEYVQQNLSLTERIKFFEHVRTCKACQSDLVLYLRLKQETVPQQPPPLITLPDKPNAIQWTLDQVKQSLRLSFKFITLGD